MRMIAPALAFAAAGCAGETAEIEARAYEIRFAFGVEAIDAEGIETLTDIVYDGSAHGAGLVGLAGHTDTAGDAAVNMELSRRRALTVRNELLARGAPRDAIELDWFGEEAPAVATGDSVREPANRRVEIALSDFGAFAPRDPDRPISFPLPPEPIR